MRNADDSLGGIPMNNGMFSTRLALLCSLLAGLLLFSPTGFAQVVERKPDLQALPANGLIISNNQLRFNTTTWNSGDGPLELRAGETGSAGQNVYQRIYLSDGGYYNRLAGTFVWHPEHNHFHFNKYAVYTLQPVNAPGASNRVSEKTTFCVMDTTPINTSLPRAPQNAVYATCGATIQGMSVGWGDTYGWTLAGQSIDLTGLPNGDYKLVIEVDSNNKIIETNDANNTSCVLIRLNITNATVQVLNATGCNSSSAAVSVFSITPNAGRRNSVNNVTITGSGFAPGMTVSFEGESGQRPSASNVIVQSATRITARVTVPKKAKIGGVWGVRVGSGVLIGGFRVAP